MGGVKMCSLLLLVFQGLPTLALIDDLQSVESSTMEIDQVHLVAFWSFTEMFFIL